MQRLFMTLAVWTSLAFADASLLLASGIEAEEMLETRFCSRGYLINWAPVRRGNTPLYFYCFTCSVTLSWLYSKTPVIICVLKSSRSVKPQFCFYFLKRFEKYSRELKNYAHKIGCPVDCSSEDIPTWPRAHSRNERLKIEFSSF